MKLDKIIDKNTPNKPSHPGSKAFYDIRPRNELDFQTASTETKT